MKTSILSALLLINSVVFSQTYSPETLEKIKKVENNITGNVIVNEAPPSTLTERMAKYNVKGLSMAVIYDYKIVWAKGYGWADEAGKKPVTTETLFEPGSISKSLNAVGILKLAQDKKVDLYTDVNTYLTTWKFPYDSVSKGIKITLAQILSHQAGLSTHGFLGHNINGPIPTVVQVLNGKPPATSPPVRSEFEPGLKYQYSGGGTTISQLVLTDVTKQKYEAWMYTNVLKPLGMIHSSFAQPPVKEKRPLCATGYYTDGSPVLNKFHVYPEQAAAGLWMTPSDLCNYIIDMQLANKGEPSKVLNPEMVKLHLTPYNDGPTAMGTFIDDLDGAKYFQHSAGNDGFCGFYFASLEDGYGLVVFMNSADGRLLQEVINSVAKEYNWKNFYREPRRINSVKIITVPDSILKTYEGIYLYENMWSAIGKNDRGYYFQTSNMAVNMYFTTPLQFFNEEFAAVKELTRDDKGNITGYTRKVEGKEYPNALKVTNTDTLTLPNEMFGEIGMYYLENKNYKEALAYFKRGSQMYPADPGMLLNMAHSYLFSNDYKNAMSIYKTHRKDVIRPGYTWEDAMRDDLIHFAEHHYNVKVFDKVFAELKIKKPKGY